MERQPKHSQTTNAAAIGAVIAEEIPAANNPRDINIVANSPYRGVSANPKSATDSIVRGKKGLGGIHCAKSKNSKFFF